MRKEEEQNLLEILKMLIESLSEGLIMVELDGRIRYANQSALEILELDIENAVGKTFADLFFYHPEIMTLLYHSYLWHSFYDFSVNKLCC